MNTPQITARLRNASMVHITGSCVINIVTGGEVTRANTHDLYLHIIEVQSAPWVVIASILILKWTSLANWDTFVSMIISSLLVLQQYKAASF